MPAQAAIQDLLRSRNVPRARQLAELREDCLQVLLRDGSQHGRAEGPYLRRSPYSRCAALWLREEGRFGWQGEAIGRVEELEGQVSPDH